MSRVCPVSGKKVMTGNNVSHANNKNKRRFLPNLQQASFLSDRLNRIIRLRITPRAIRTVERKGGIDGYLAATSASRLSPELLPLKRSFEKACARGDKNAT